METFIATQLKQASNPLTGHLKLMWHFIVLSETGSLHLSAMISPFEEEEGHEVVNTEICTSNLVCYKVGSSLEKPFEDALALPVIEQHKIRFILVMDYTTVIAYNRTVKNQAVNLPKLVPSNSRDFL